MTSFSCPASHLCPGPWEGHAYWALAGLLELTGCADSRMPLEDLRNLLLLIRSHSLLPD